MQIKRAAIIDKIVETICRAQREEKELDYNIFLIDIMAETGCTDRKGKEYLGFAKKKADRWMHEETRSAPQF